MANYTEHYGLHQWEGTDNFLREDFNEDFEKIDTALAEVNSSLQTALADAKSDLQADILNNSYNLYNLMLQNYYEGKSVDYKIGLYMDGFLVSEEREERSLSDSLMAYDDNLYLSVAGQSNVVWAATTNTRETTGNSGNTLSHTLEGAGVLTGVTLYVASGTTTSYNTIRCIVNSEIVETGTIYYSNSTGNTVTYLLETPIPLSTGDEVYFSLPSVTTYGMTYYTSSTNGISLAATMLFTSHSGSTGSATYSDTMGIDWSQCHLWVRYTGGSIGASLGGSAMTLVETQSAQTLDGQQCSESYLTGDGGSDQLNFVLSCQRTGDSDMIVYDYGLIFV